MILETRFVLPYWAMDAGNDDEQWAEIDYGYYVSDYGRIWSGRSQKFLKPKRMDKYGHVGFVIHNGGRDKYLYLHRLVAEEFIPNPRHYPIVRHLNDDPTDNRAENLAWGTQKDNMHDSIEAGRSYTLTDEDREIGYEKVRIPVIAKNLRTGKEIHFRSQTDAARELNIQQANIWKVLHGERRMAGGYSFVWE